MTDEQVLLAALHPDPGDDAAWLALADCLEEAGQVQRAELLRLHRGLRGQTEGPHRQGMEVRIQHLLQAGVRPCVPTLTNSIGMQFVLIPAGAFLMGSPAGESERNEDEQQHPVEITRPFYLGAFPVTQAQWQAVMGCNPSYFCAGGGGKDKVERLDTSDFPVEQVNWEDATAFLAMLSALEEEREVGRKYRLPTEAEWEYCCRGGASSFTPYHFADTIDSNRANFNGNLRRTSKVGSYQPNGFGLYDMHGNVWEWCQDWYDKNCYGKSPPADPPGPPQGTFRVIRGGSWDNGGLCCRSAFRDWYMPDYGNDYLGFRAALVPSGQ
jgi:uncharacterized protein (TIGR02996 family)